LLLLVLLVPSLVHLTDKTSDNVRAPANALSDDEFNKRLNEMVPPPEMPKPP
jgi:hypothetical protein